MWPYIIRINTRALLLLTVVFSAIVLFWYYLLIGSQQLTNSWLTSANIDLKKLLIAGVMASIRGGQEVVKVRNNNHLNQRSKGKTREGVDDVLTQGDLLSHSVMVHSLSATFPGLRIISEEHSSDEDNNMEIIPIVVSDELLYDERYSKLPFDIEIPLGELTVWVDPLDATKEYSEGLTQFVTTMVCIARSGEPIIGIIHKPFSSETYWSWNGKGMSNNIISSLNSSNKKSNDTFRVIVSRSHAGNVESFVKKSLNTEYKNIEVISAAGSGYKTIEVIEGRADTYVHNTLIKKWDICAPNAIFNSIVGAKMTTMDGKAIDYSYEEEVKNEKGLLASIHQNHQKILDLFQNYKL